jgi:hypothetical protein
MEKKGDLLNQLAIISDLLDNMVLSTESKTIVLELKDEQFNAAFEIIKKKYNKKADKPKDTFSISIGDLDIIFNKSNA